MVSGEFAEADLTPSSSRYTEEECQEAMDEFMDAKIDYEEGNFYPQETLIMQTMIDKFLDGSDAFKTLSKKEQQAAPSILSDLIQILHDEEMKVVLRTLDDEVLNNIIFSEFLYFYENPTKEFSRTIPRVYAAFFSFLAEINYAVHGKRISEYLKESEQVISEAIENPRLWEIFKEAEAAAEAAGLDQSQEAFHDYVQNYIVKHPEFKVKTIQHNQKEIKVIPPPELDTEGLKPGDRITVKYYANGLLKQDVKFKQVQKDLEEGKCKLLRR
jgi:predicted nucleic acid-binding protein